MQCVKGRLRLLHIGPTGNCSYDDLSFPCLEYMLANVGAPDLLGIIGLGRKCVCSRRSILRAGGGYVG
jgi:hypothetical protein